MRFAAMVISFVLTVLAGGAALATGVVLEFDDIYDIGGGQSLEAGFRYENGSTYNPGDRLLLHDDDGGITLSQIRMDNGGTFDALTADISGSSRLYKTGKKKRPRDPSKLDKWLYGRNLTYENYAFYGYREGVLVGSLTGALNGSASLSFGADFLGIDLLVAKLLVPDAVVDFFGEISKRRTLFCREWCGDFSIHRMGLYAYDPAPVPLPAGLPLLAGGLGLLAAVRRKGRSLR